MLRPLQLHVLAAAMVNHSCLPSVDVEASWADGTPAPVLCLRAIRDVAKGEEIFFAYTDVDEGVDFIDRNLRLKDGYGFTCVCVRCVVEEATCRDTQRETDEE